MYKLYGSIKSRAFRAVWILEELGVEYELIPTAPRSDEAFAVNPSGKVPVLEADGSMIIDSTAIIQFLADRHKQFTFDAGSIERAQQDSFLGFANDEMDSVCWTMAKHKFVLPKEYREHGVFEACSYEWKMAMETLSQRLGDKLYVMGDQVTVPDFVIAHVAGWATLYKFELGHDNLRAYVDRVRARPAFQKVSDLRRAAG